MTDRTTPQEASRAAFEALPFTIDTRDRPVRILRWKEGGCRPAEEEELAMWDGWQAATAAREAEVDALRQALARACDFMGTVHEGEYGYTAFTRDQLVEQFDSLLKEPQK